MSVPAVRCARSRSAARVAAPDEPTFECHGTVVRLQSDDASLLARLQRRLPPGTRPCAGGSADVAYRVRRSSADAAGAAGHVLTVQSAGTERRVRLARSNDEDVLVARFAHDVQFRVALHAPVRLFVHAGAVAWQGRVIALPGRTWTGKSTLAAALLRAGAHYYSDEFLVLDESGLAHAFPRLIHLRSLDGRTARHVRPDALGVVGTMPLPLGMVVATAYRAGAPWRPRSMTPGQTALVLLANAVVARTRPAHALRCIARAVDHGVTGLRGSRAEADDAARRLLDLAGDLFAGSPAP